MVHDSVISCIGRTPLVKLQRLFPPPGPQVIAKLEMLNPGGSIKDRPARFIIEEGLRTGVIRPDSHLVESSSGNLGIAVAMVAKHYGLRFTCVVDPKITPTNLLLLQRMGAEVDMVREPDDSGGYLKTRIQRVHELTQTLPNAFWINQYANELNWQAHYYGTAQEILDELDGPVDYLVVAVSTTGTLLGVSRRLRSAFPDMKVVAVDAVGSVIFGGPPGSRELPGVGASRVPELCSPQEVDQVIYVSDLESALACHELISYEGILAGGSSGSVIAAIQKLIPTIAGNSRVVTVLPDRGERYLDMVYDQRWVAKLTQRSETVMATVR